MVTFLENVRTEKPLYKSEELLIKSLEKISPSQNSSRDADRATSKGRPKYQGPVAPSQVIRPMGSYTRVDVGSQTTLKNEGKHNPILRSQISQFGSYNRNEPISYREQIIKHMVPEDATENCDNDSNEQRNKEERQIQNELHLPDDNINVEDQIKSPEKNSGDEEIDELSVESIDQQESSDPDASDGSNTPMHLENNTSGSSTPTKLYHSDNGVETSNFESFKGIGSTMANLMRPVKQRPHDNRDISQVLSDRVKTSIKVRNNRTNHSPNRMSGLMKAVKMLMKVMKTFGGYMNCSRDEMGVLQIRTSHYSETHCSSTKRTSLSSHDNHELLYSPRSMKIDRLPKFIPVTEIYDKWDSQREFIIQGKIAKGTYGHIHKVISSKDNNQYAIKEIELKNRGEVHGLVLTEIAIFKQVTDHPNIIDLKQVIIGTNSIFIVMQFAPIDLDDYSKYFRPEISNNQSLLDKYMAHRKMMDSSKWNLRAIRYIFRQIIEAVAYLHEMSIIHRDLKLKNVLIFPKGQEIKLTDFGLACYKSECSANQQRSNMVVTLWYRPIELFIKPAGYGQEIDAWSCGIMYYALLQNDPPVCMSEVTQFSELVKRYRPTKEDLCEIGMTDQQKREVSDHSKKGIFRGVDLVDYLLSFSKKATQLSRGMICPQTKDKELIGSLLDPSRKNRISVKEALYFMTENHL